MATYNCYITNEDDRLIKVTLKQQEKECDKTEEKVTEEKVTEENILFHIKNAPTKTIKQIEDEIEKNKNDNSGTYRWNCIWQNNDHKFS